MGSTRLDGLIPFTRAIYFSKMTPMLDMCSHFGQCASLRGLTVYSPAHVPALTCYIGERKALISQSLGKSGTRSLKGRKSEGDTEVKDSWAAAEMLQLTGGNAGTRPEQPEVLFEVGLGPPLLVSLGSKEWYPPQGRGTWGPHVVHLFTGEDKIMGRFDTIIGVMVLLNALAMAINLECLGAKSGTALGIANGDAICVITPALDFSEHFFAAVFTMELLYRLYRIRCDYFRDAWNWLDASLVLVAVVDLYVVDALLADSPANNATTLRVFRVALLPSGAPFFIIF